MVHQSMHSTKIINEYLQLGSIWTAAFLVVAGVCGIALFIGSKLLEQYSMGDERLVNELQNLRYFQVRSLLLLSFLYRICPFTVQEERSELQHMLVAPSNTSWYLT
jgi:hypothetical protein